MRTVLTKALIGSFTAAALLASAFATPADARGMDMRRGGHGGHFSHSHVTAFRGGGFRGGFASGGWNGVRGSNHGNYTSNYYGGGYYGGAFGAGAVLGALGAAVSAPFAAVEEGCLVRQPIWSHGRIVGHRWINAC